MKFRILGVAIHPEKQNEILRPMVKELAQLDLPFLSYGQKTVNFLHFSKNRKNILFFGHNSKMVRGCPYITLSVIMGCGSGKR